jgi:hypothetical protein
VGYSYISDVLVGFTYIGGETGTLKLYTSTDGSAWTERQSITPTNAAWKYFLLDPAWLQAGTVYLRIELQNTGAGIIRVCQIVGLTTRPGDTSGLTGGSPGMTGCGMRDGIVSSVGWGWYADRDSGLYRIGSNNWGMAAGGSLIVDVGSAGLNLASGKVLKVNSTQVVTSQQTALTAQLTTITCSAPGTPDYAIADLVEGALGFTTLDEGLSVLKVIANLQVRVGELETKLKAHGLIA